MPEFLTLLPPDEARDKLIAHLSAPEFDSDSIDILHALGRVTAEDILAPHPAALAAVTAPTALRKSRRVDCMRVSPSSMSARWDSNESVTATPPSGRPVG